MGPWGHCETQLGMEHGTQKQDDWRRSQGVGAVVDGRWGQTVRNLKGQAFILKGAVPGDWWASGG